MKRYAASLARCNGLGAGRAAGKGGALGTVAEEECTAELRRLRSLLMADLRRVPAPSPAPPTRRSYYDTCRDIVDDGVWWEG